MRLLPHLFGRSLTIVALSVIASVMALAFSSPGRSATQLAAQAFQSPIKTPTPLPSPSPVPPSPTPPYRPSNEALRALTHVATRYGLPSERLTVVNEHRREYPLLRRNFRAVTIHDRGGTGFYQLLVDLADSRIEEDVPTIERAAAAAYQARYGKLQSALYERLQQVGDNEVLPVAIWSGTPPGRDRQQLYAELAARFPEAAAALARSGHPFDVGDPILADRIRAVYMGLLGEDTQARLAPLIKLLQARGISVKTFGGVPSVAVELPKRLIQELSHRQDVNMIYLVEDMARPTMDIANQTTLVSQARGGLGLTGVGQRIAVLEMGNIVPTDNCLPLSRMPERRIAGTEPIPGHKTRVANVAACNDTAFGGIYTGVAPAAEIIDAGFDGTPTDALAALQWATQPERNARVVNVSLSWSPGTFQMQWIDRAFDWWARQGQVATVAAAGNRQPPENSLYVTSPARAYNVSAVGAFDDHNTPSWPDDTMWPDSAYLDPWRDWYYQGDREKPELVAPGVDVTMINTDGQPAPADRRSGTSYAAPQVAGIAALLLQQNADLRPNIHVLKPILMAAANHNIEGPPGIPSGEELKDGAGGVNAALAASIAQRRWYSSWGPCPGSCWYHMFITPAYPGPGSPVSCQFSAATGDEMRVAISWWSASDGNNDSLPTNLGLAIYDPDNQLVPTVYDNNGQRVEQGDSNSWDNNYEIMRFIARKTGTYEIRISRTPTGVDEDNDLGIAVARIYRVWIPLVVRD